MQVSLNELETVAHSVLEECISHKKQSATIIALEGALGAGKTTFVQLLAKELGITDIVQSPTYVLMRSYSILFHQFRTLIHIDAYRLESPEEFEVLRPHSFLSDASVLMCIEWPERVVGTLPEPDVCIELSHTEARAETRDVVVIKHIG